MDEVDGIVRKRGLYVNRQQFIESVIREKVEKLRLVEDREAMAEVLSQEVDDAFLVHVKETFLAHVIIGIVKEGTLPTSHLDVKQFEERVRQFIKKTVELEGRKITKKRQLSKLHTINHNTSHTIRACLILDVFYAKL